MMGGSNLLKVSLVIKMQQQTNSHFLSSVDGGGGTGVYGCSYCKWSSCSGVGFLFMAVQEDAGVSVHLGIGARNKIIHATIKMKTNQINNQSTHHNG